MFNVTVPDTEVSFVSSKINASQMNSADICVSPETAQGKKQDNPLVR